MLLCRFHGEKKEELLGVASNRVMRMNLQTGDHIKTWRYSTMKVNNIFSTEKRKKLSKANEVSAGNGDEWLLIN